MSFFEEFEKSLNESLRRQRDNVEKLRLDPCMDIPEVGDTVLVNAGAVNRGHEWEVLEARVLKVAKTAYYVEFQDRAYEDKAWINPIVITEVLKTNKERYY